MDRISDLPLCITETIMGLLPYQDVVRTSALSKEWRYRWTKIPKIMVIADWQTLDRNKLLCGAGQALLMHEGPIHEFTLSIVKYECGMYWEIDRVISQLSSKKTLKKLTIDFVNGACSGYKPLPSSLFSMAQLTVLYLNGCDLIYEPTFSRLKHPRKRHTSWLSKKEERLKKTSSGLGSLSSLYVQNSQISIKTLLNLLSKSPFLKTVELKSYEFYDSGDATITNLFESFKLIESLTISRGIIQFFALNGNHGRTHERVPITLLHLNYFQQDQYPRMDRISNLPLSIIETILCLLPYQEVVRTSTLSKEWRYHWTNVTKIVVTQDRPSELLWGVGQALLMHEGPIHEVTLSVVADYWGFDAEIRRIISHLSSDQKAVKKLTIDFGSRGCRLMSNNSLPISLFSMSHLTDLYLNGCKFRHNFKRRRKVPDSWAPKKKKKQNKTSSRFGNLTSLYLINSAISIKTLLRLLPTCPLLKTVTLKTHNFYDFKGVTNTNLFESLTLIESLTICPEIIEDLAPGAYPYTIPRKVPVDLVHLKYICIDGLYFADHYYRVQVITLLIRSSPNLEKLKLNIMYTNWRVCSLALEEDIWMERLSELEIINISSDQTQLDFVKLILMRSPALKKFRVFISKKSKDVEMQISETLLSAPRASPVAELIFEKEPF